MSEENTAVVIGRIEQKLDNCLDILLGTERHEDIGLIKRVDKVEHKLTTVYAITGSIVALISSAGTYLGILWHGSKQ